MLPNPVLRKLGYADSDRLVILHMDDVGSSQSTLSAYVDLLDFGLISSAAVMVPCAWFPMAAELCRKNPEIDMGVHLTLNSEWESCRWRPVSTADRATGLIDDEGYFHRRHAPVQSAANPQAVRIELDKQIDMAVASGISPTHVDSHMGTLAHVNLLPEYVDVALARRLPPTILFRGDKAGFSQRGARDALAHLVETTSAELEARGIPLIDDEVGMPLDDHRDRIEVAKHLLSELKPGITHFYMHPSHDTPELRAMAPDWQCRVADYEAFMSREVRDHIRKQGIHVIGNRVLLDLMQQAN